MKQVPRGEVAPTGAGTLKAREARLYNDREKSSTKLSV
jgi:hypothetical protein